jgi:poly-gamma-glutamate synthesis protein (capsule biosynthesis protein)
MRLVDAYGANDDRSMEADNTSAFNCRFVAGTNDWSMHAYGKAIDLNPVENPYVSGRHVSPEKGAKYADRCCHRAIIHSDDEVVRAFASVGWGWGGSWSDGTKDYQHFSTTGG